MSLTPKTPIPEGAIRFNTDSSKMEVWVGDKWMQVAVSSPNLDGGARGLFGGGGYPNNQNIIDFITIASTGNATDFGDLFEHAYNLGGMASETRALFVGAYQLSPYSQGYKNIIQFITIQTTGNGSDFGDMLVNRGQNDGSTSDCHGGLSE